MTTFLLLLALARFDRPPAFPAPSCSFACPCGCDPARCLCAPEGGCAHMFRLWGDTYPEWPPHHLGDLHGKGRCLPPHRSRPSRPAPILLEP